MKLTKSQRYTAYCIMLEEAKRPTKFIDFTGLKRLSNDCGLCFMASRIFAIDFLLKKSHLEYQKIEDMLPEYFNRYNKTIINNPKRISWVDRIEILKQCIKETENF